MHWGSRLLLSEASVGASVGGFSRTLLLNAFLWRFDACSPLVPALRRLPDTVRNQSETSIIRPNTKSPFNEKHLSSPFFNKFLIVIAQEIAEQVATEPLTTIDYTATD